MHFFLILAAALSTPVIDPTDNLGRTISVRTVVGTATASARNVTGNNLVVTGTLIAGSTIPTSGTIKTGDKSGLVLELPDGCLVWVGPNTNIDFPRFDPGSHEWSLDGGAIVAKITDAGATHLFKVRTQIGEVRVHHGVVRVGQHSVKSAIRDVTVDVGVADGVCEYTTWARPTKRGEGLLKAGDEVQASIAPPTQPHLPPGPSAFVHPLSPTSAAEINEALKQLTR